MPDLAIPQSDEFRTDLVDIKFHYFLDIFFCNETILRIKWAPIALHAFLMSRLLLRRFWHCQFWH